ncbi:peptidylprolyl isomerase [Vitreimonas sp.]|uniref:peptidylprolyl isomerase n=1 Tax=Vitreimonas sp. TaxID=3069702 RepID=UPI002ED9D866
MKHTLIQAKESQEPFGGCGHGPAPAAQRARNAPPVFVNGVAVSEADIAFETQNHRAASGPEARAAAARALVIRELLLQRAAALGLQAAPCRDDAGREETPEEALVRQVLELEAQPREPTADECLRVYAASPDSFTTMEIYEASHILCAPEQPGAEAWVAAHGRAVAVRRQIQEGADFAKLARAHSNCPTGSDGGALGQLAVGDLAGELERVLLALRQGEVAAAPVRTRHGWHIVRLDRHAPARRLPFDVVEPAIRVRLRERALVSASARYVAELARQAEIEGLDLRLGAA